MRQACRLALQLTTDLFIPCFSFPVKQDYDDIRTCCKGAAVCDKCWVLMSAAIKVIDTTLRHDFGFKHILWVFSGRRGVHCWVCDTRSRKLSHDQRAAIVDFLSIYGGKEKKVNLGVTGAGGTLHPSLQRAYEQLLPYFEDMIDTQGWFDNKDKVEQILADYVDGQHSFMSMPAGEAAVEAPASSHRAAFADLLLLCAAIFCVAVACCSQRACVPS